MRAICFVFIVALAGSFHATSAHANMKAKCTASLEKASKKVEARTRDESTLRRWEAMLKNAKQRESGGLYKGCHLIAEKILRE